MALRWAASGLVATGKNFQRLDGYKHLWMLKAYLDPANEESLTEKRSVG